MIISAVKNNFVQKYQSKPQQKSNFAMTKSLASDTFQSTTMKPVFKGRLTFEQIAKATIKSLNQDIIMASNNKEYHSLPALYLKKAEIEARINQKGKALESLNQVSKSISNNLTADRTGNLASSLRILQQKADLEQAMGFKKNVIRTLSTIVKLAPEEEKNHIDLINMQINYGYKEGAYKSINKAAKQFPDNIQWLEDKLHYEEHLNKIPESVNTLGLMIKINPYDPDLYNHKAYKEFVLQDISASLKTIEEGIQANPKEVRFYEYKSHVESKIGKIPDAIETLQQGIKNNPNEIYFYSKKAELEQQIQKPHEAINTLEEGIKNNPKVENFYMAKATLEISLKNFEDASQTLNKGIEANPESVILYNNRGVLNISQNKLEKAEEDFDVALEKDPGNVLRSLILLNKSFIQEMKGDQAKSIDFLEQSLTFYPQNKNAMNSLYNKTIITAKQGKVEETNELFKKIIKFNPDDDVIHISKVYLNLATDNPKEALEGFKPFIDKHSKDPLTLAYSAALHSMTGDVNTAQQDFLKSHFYLKEFQNKGEALDEVSVNTINNLGKIVKAKNAGQEIEFPKNPSELASPDYRPKSKFDWENLDDDIKPDWE